MRLGSLSSTLSLSQLSLLRQYFVHLRGIPEAPKLRTMPSSMGVHTYVRMQNERDSRRRELPKMRREICEIRAKSVSDQMTCTNASIKTWCYRVFHYTIGSGNSDVVDTFVVLIQDTRIPARHSLDGKAEQGPKPSSALDHIFIWNKAIHLFALRPYYFRPNASSDQKLLYFDSL